MAKMFYTMEETKAALERNEEDIKQLAREGRLREFRDGPRLMFKADQVEQLKGEIGAGGETSLASDTGAPIGLAGDSKGGSSVLPMADSFSGKPATGAGDTAFADSLGGSVGGVPSPTKGDTRMGTGLGTGLGSGLTGSGLPGSGLTGTGISSAGGTRAGVTVFDVDDRERVDPSAQTAINPNVAEHGAMDQVGSGSGLLDLTRESDDTSLGAVFDELTPGGSTAGGSSGRRTASQIAASALGGSAISAVAGQETQAGELGLGTPERGARIVAPVYVEAADPVGNAIGWAALGGVIVVAVGMFILGSSVLGYRPDFLETLAQGGMMYLGIAVGLIAVLGIVGFVTGRGRTA